MNLRGPTLLLFGASLILSPLALALAQDEDAAPSAIRTMGAEAAACDAQSLTLPGGQRIGCNRGGAQREAARVMPGGATFVMARN